ncbi:hypothetical protein N0V83_007551 [Neocucurbitaria cava]|uniref:Swi5-domain-containing protein n=1 Tax=Neocucurbitaria cava TaxID=798079 RepID=A0A9W8Y6L5_9PLEO|nr:hypothetical protein N0V83_007551 [Neocucurbitaria cava]
MAIRQGRSEIPDSEDEPMTSSPANVSNEALDKLSPPGPAPSQDAQETRQAAKDTHQAYADHVGITVSGDIEGLNADRDNASMNIDASQFDHINTQLKDAALHERPQVETCDDELKPSSLGISSQPESSYKSALAVHDAPATRTMHPVEADLYCPDLRCEPTATVDQNLGEQSINAAFGDGTITSVTNSGDSSFASGLKDHTQQRSAKEPSASQADPAALIASLRASFADVPHTTEPMDVETNNVNKTKASVCVKEGETASPGIEDNTAKLERTLTPTLDNGNSSLSLQDPGHIEFQNSEHGNINDERGNQVQSNRGHNIDQPVAQSVNYGRMANGDRPKELTPRSTHSITQKTSQEITLAELKAQKAALLASLATLPAIQVLVEETASSQAEQSDGGEEPTETDIMAAASKIVKDHIKLLHEYNELKDVGQGLMGLIADQRGVRIVEVQDEFGIDAND